MVYPFWLDMLKIGSFLDELSIKVCKFQEGLYILDSSWCRPIVMGAPSRKKSPMYLNT